MPIVIIEVLYLKNKNRCLHAIHMDSIAIHCLSSYVPTVDWIAI